MPLSETAKEPHTEAMMERLSPFGIKITAPASNSLEDFFPDYLDQLVSQEKLVLLRGFRETPRDRFLNYCSSFPGRKLLEWDFGPVMELLERPDPKNYLFSREKVPFHWDGAFHQVPNFLAFYCVEAPTLSGGETLFTNTELIWEKAKTEERALYSKITLTYETQKLAHYGGAFTIPLLQNHPLTGSPILRFAESVETELNPVHLEVSGIDENETDIFLKEMSHRIYESDYCYEHRWQTHDVLLVDNHSLIHGRRAFQQDSPRHLRRIQII